MCKNDFCKRLKNCRGSIYINPYKRTNFSTLSQDQLVQLSALIKRWLDWCNRNNYSNFHWQRNYYEHIIRNDNELKLILEYIINNPLRWKYDGENPEGIPDDRETEFWANFT